MGRLIKRGEIRWYQFSKPDKKRPVVILTRDSAIEFLGEITVAPVTSTIREIPTEVVLTKLEGMPKECAINLDHIQTITKGKIGALITRLPPEKMSELGLALMFAFGFDE